MRVQFNADCTKAYGSENDFENADDFGEAVRDVYKAITGKSCTSFNFDFDEYVIPEQANVGEMTKVDDMAPEYYYTADVKEVRE